MSSFTREEVLNMAIVESGVTVLLHCKINGDSGTVILHRKGDEYRPLFVSVTEGMELEIPALNRGPVRPKGHRSRWTLRTAGLG